MNLDDLRRKAKKGIKAPKRKRIDTPVVPIVPIDVEVNTVVNATSPSIADIAKAYGTLANLGKLSEKQAEKFVQLCIDPSVILEDEKENEK